MRCLIVTLSFFAILCLSLAQPADYDFDCTGLPDNFIYWWGCGSYGVCRGGRYFQIDCVNGTSYDRRHADCIPNSQAVTFPCNSAPVECLSFNGPGHRYPDRTPDPLEALPSCTFYFTCSYGRYLGHQRCPEGTVYDEPQQRCLPPPQVAPPCGTYTDHITVNPFQYQGSDAEGRAVVQPPTDSYGNLDTNKWPFTGNRPGRYDRPPRSSGHPQRLAYRSPGRAGQSQELNPAVYRINPNEFTSNEGDLK